MPTDLTERLAAKLERIGLPTGPCACGAYLPLQDYAHEILPLLLSEPELVASLPDATKAALLRTLLGERLVRMKGEELLRADAAFARLAASWKAKVFNAVTHNTLRARFVEIIAPNAPEAP